MFDAVDAGRYSALTLPTIAHAQITAFAGNLSVYPDADAYATGQADDTKFAVQSFIPSGLFEPSGESVDPPESTAIFSGRVVAAETKTNSLTGAKYYWALVDSLSGSFDIVIDPAICDGQPDVGGVISGSFWLCGRLIM